MKVPPKPLERALEFASPEIIERFKQDHPALCQKDPTGELPSLLYKETLKWLWACAKLQEDRALDPSLPKTLLITPEMRPIDLMWHTFLLFTREYKRYCDEVLGVFIHHDPVTAAERESFRKKRDENPAQALKERQDQLRPQLQYLKKILGEQTLVLWYQTLPKLMDSV